MRISNRAVFVTGVLLCLVPVAVFLGPLGVIAALDLALTLGFVIGSVVLSLLAMSAGTKLPILLKPFRLLFLITLWLGSGAFALSCLAVGTELISHKLVADGGASYLAIERGEFGSTWTDVVERQSVAFVLFRERPLAQFQRESVVNLSMVAGTGLMVDLAEYGKPRRQQLIVLPGH